MTPRDSRPRYRPHHVLAILLFAASTIVALAGVENFGHLRSQSAIWNLGHVAYFFLFTALLALVPAFARMPQRQRWRWALAICTVVGLTLEIIQLGTARHAHWLDILRNTVGMLLALAFLGFYCRGFSFRTLLALRLAGLGMLFLLSLPLAIALLDETIAGNQFPILVNFETPFETGRIQAINSTISVESNDSGKHLAIDVPNNRQYGGINLEHFPGDWSGYRKLRLRLYNASDETRILLIKIYDRTHPPAFDPFDRYDQKFNLGAGWSEIEVSIANIVKAPRQRPMNLEQIHNLSLVVLTQNQRFRFWFDRAMLVR